MMVGRTRNERGMTLVVVLIMILLMSAIGAVLMTAVDRNSEMRGTYQKTVNGFQAAEAGINVGSDHVLNEMGNNIQPSGSDCNPNFGGSPLSINGLTVTYTLSGCGQSSTLQTLPADDPFAGLSAWVSTYTLTSTAVDSSGFTEGNLKMEFYARQIPMYQFVFFSNADMVSTPGTATISTGRSHTNGNVYLDNGDCGGSGSGGGGFQILGQITFVKNMYRGNTQGQTHGHVWISTDGTQANEVVFGETAPGDTSCVMAPSSVPGRGPIGQSELNTFNGRVRKVNNITLPGGPELYCAPWDCPGSMTAGANTLWQKADLRLVLDLTAAPAHLSGAFGPALPPINVVDVNGNVIAAATTSLHTLMQNVPGIITYTDVPTSGANIDCRASISGTYPACEATYSNGSNYTPKFPGTTSTCPVAQVSTRNTRALITANNYCYDYRYGGYYDWEDVKPRIILNVDWMALEEWNHDNANALFNPAGGAGNNGVDVFLTVHGPNSAGVNNYGVRVFDAARARRGTSDLGMTFASDQWIYVAGTFNCPNPNTSGGTGVPETCGASGAQKGTSIVGDRLDQLSCAWSSSSVATTPCSTFSMDVDQWPGWPASGGSNISTYRLRDEYSTCGQSGVQGCTTNGTVPSPYGNGSPGGVQATLTYSNHAGLVGSDPTWCPTDHTGATCASQWNGPGTGGFDESWAGTQYWFITAGANLGTSQHTCYAYAAGINPTDDPSFPCTAYPEQGFYDRRYAPPTRLGFYDTSFGTIGNLPPVTPFFVSLRQVLFTDPFQ